MKILRGVIAWSAFVLAGVTSIAADPPLIPFGVCEVVRDLAAHEGKSVAVIGRYSSRTAGRWVSEDACSPASDGPPELWLIEDPKTGPKAPSNFDLDAPTLDRKFADIQRRTTLGKFRFGSSDYDRWAVVYGRVEPRKGEDAKKAAANLVYRSSGVIVFLTTE